MVRDLQTHLEQGRYDQALALLDKLHPESGELSAAVRAALALGRPSLAVRWSQQQPDRDERSALNLAAAYCRLGEGQAALAELTGQPDNARVSVLRARASHVQGSASLTEIQHAVTRARQEGDAPALIAALTLHGETLLTAGDGRAALRTLAEGLKIAELLSEAADAHLLAILAHAQATIGSPGKARATAVKALARSAPRSPARVNALLALGREDEAQREARDGELHPRWLLPPLTSTLQGT